MFVNKKISKNNKLILKFNLIGVWMRGRVGVDDLAGNALVSLEKEIRGRKEKCEQHKQNDTADPWEPLTHQVQRYKKQGNIYQLARLKRWRNQRTRANAASAVLKDCQAVKS